MSVNFYHCYCCKESIYEEYIDYCSNGKHRICTSCLENKDVDSHYSYDFNVKFDDSESQKEKYSIQNKQEDPEYGYEIGEIIDDTGIDSKYCPFCNKSAVSESDLLEYILNKLNLTKEQVEREFLNGR